MSFEVRSNIVVVLHVRNTRGYLRAARSKNDDTSAAKKARQYIGVHGGKVARITVEGHHQQADLS